MVIGTIELFHFKPFAEALTLLRYCKKSGKQICLVHFLATLITDHKKIVCVKKNLVLEQLFWYRFHAKKMYADEMNHTLVITQNNKKI